MDEPTRRALMRGQIIDITTIGRRSGRPRRLEIVLHAIAGRLYISGIPSRRTRAWIHNLVTDDRITIHLKGDTPADIPGRARILTDPDERRTVLETIARTWRRADVDAMVEWSPLIEVVPDESVAAA